MVTTTEPTQICLPCLESGLESDDNITVGTTWRIAERTECAICEYVAECTGDPIE